MHNFPNSGALRVRAFEIKPFPAYRHESGPANLAILDPIRIAGEPVCPPGPIRFLLDPGDPEALAGFRSFLGRECDLSWRIEAGIMAQRADKHQTAFLMPNEAEIRPAPSRPPDLVRLEGRDCSILAEVELACRQGDRSGPAWNIQAEITVTVLGHNPAASEGRPGLVESIICESMIRPGADPGAPGFLRIHMSSKAAVVSGLIAAGASPWDGPMTPDSLDGPVRALLDWRPGPKILAAMSEIGRKGLLKDGPPSFVLRYERAIGTGFEGDLRLVAAGRGCRYLEYDPAREVFAFPTPVRRLADAGLLDKATGLGKPSPGHLEPTFRICIDRLYGNFGQALADAGFRIKGPDKAG